MREDVRDVLDRLRAGSAPELVRVVDAVERLPAATAWPDVVEPYRWFLSRVGNGVKLTSAGWLPPAFVVETMQHLGWAVDWYGKANREEHARPVADLRESARQLGLVRDYRGELRCTTAGRRFADDPEGLWHHLAAHLPLGRSEPERQAALLWLMAFAARATHVKQLVVRGMWALGWAAGGTHRPLEKHEAFAAYRDTWVVFDRLGVLGRSWRDDPPVPAAVDLARAALSSPGATPTPRRPSQPAPAFRLTVGLRDVTPPVRRTIVVPESISLRRLHAVIQAAMGWENAHLYLFDIDGISYAEVEDMDDEFSDVGTELRSVAKEGGTFRYHYDFGDGWQHDIRVVGRETPDGAHCVDGARACPPEDCGGPGGYARILEAQADRNDPEHEDVTAWLGRPFDPTAFDMEAADWRVQRALSARARGRR